ncbi:MAG: hypothetical protein ACOC6M_04000 [Halobacteriota archaeon]
MPWGGMMYDQQEFWTGIILGFGVLAVIMLVGFYFLLQSIQSLKDSLSRMENKVENTEKRVEDMAKQLEEI